MPTLYSDRELDLIKDQRELCRKDLFFLSTEYLNYKDVFADLHGPFIKPLDDMVRETSGIDHVEYNGQHRYYPSVEELHKAISLEIKRNYLLLAFRGSLKTSLQHDGSRRPTDSQLPASFVC